MRPSARAFTFVATAALAGFGCGDNGKPAAPADATTLPGDTGPGAAAPTITVLSSRAEFVSGGDALIEVKAPAGVATTALSVSLNGQSVIAQLTDTSAAAAGSLRGVIKGLTDGNNALTATAGGTEATLTLVNHPLTGPILAGPLQTPYECRTVESGLGAPLDANCTATQKIEYFYQATTGAFKPLPDPTAARPADLAMTTTITGAVVPYIVRVDSGTINRTIYRIAVLDEPTVDTLDVARWHPGAGWNGRFMVAFGGGAGTAYHQGVNQATGALNALVLGRGFAYAISTELVNQTRGNAVLQGETLMMIKEYFIEHYGVPKWTVGTGGSGGAIQQLTITEMYPGLLDGLQPSMAFPDGSLHVADCGLLNNFYAKDAATWTPAKTGAVDGFFPGTCGSWVASFVPIIQAARVENCGLTDTSLVYNPTTNPHGARCTPQDTRVNIYGRDPATGFARDPLDNVGLQYGLGALNKGAITVEEFLDLNEGIGGWTVDGLPQAQRTHGDPIALAATYQSGLMNGGGGGLATVPILHFRNYTDVAKDIHSRERDFNIRARLIRANGNADNQVIWVGPTPTTTATLSLAAPALDVMTKWLDALVADPAPLTATKVVANKPAEAVDACFDAAGTKIAEPAVVDAVNTCNTMYPVHSEPRMVAGAPLTNDVGKCALKQIDFADYTPVFSDAQQTRAKAIFAEGVCDFSKPGVGQGPMLGTYQHYPR